jgi:Zn-dependent peptidase ImmA (M78 family)/DNA-binding XRE family transcriptional regulator
MHLLPADQNSPDLGERLKRARTEKGWSTRAVAEMLQPITKVSHATLANYEKGATRPPIQLMMALATLYERPLNWFLSTGPALTGVRYRNLRSKVGVRDRQQFEAESLRWCEAYIRIETYLGQPLKRVKSFAPVIAKNAADAAMVFRREVLNLGETDPLPSVVEAMELLGVRVLEAHTDLSIDGMAGLLGDQHVVFLNPNVSHDRARMNAAHELAHVVLGDCSAEQKKDDERRAFEFASHVLLTKEMLRRAFARKSVVDLVRFKEQFGISLAAMVYRAQQEQIITDAEAKFLWIEFTKRGWRTKEPGQVWSDRPLRFEALIDSALVERRASLEQLASVAGVREVDLRRRLARATGAEHYGAEQEETDQERYRLKISH